MVAGEELLEEEYSLVLEPKVSGGTKSLSSNKGVISLDIVLTQDLIDEGIARDIIRLVQQARKDAEFDVSDRIKLELKSGMDLTPVLKAHKDLIEEQTLSQISAAIDADYKTEAELSDNKLEIALQRI